MIEKIKEFKLGVEEYRKLAEKSAEKGNYKRALSHLFSALNSNKNHYEIYGDIAEIYTEINQHERATEYWFKFLSIAPEQEKATAFEGLALNYFYLDKMFESGYYLHKKVAKDGFISKDEFSEELADFIASEEPSKKAYHIAYPFDRADYSFEKKMGKKAFTLGDFRSAVTIYDKIPIECMDEETFGDKSVACFLQDLDEEAIKACKDSLRINGENLTAYCNLCTYYFSKENYDKSTYYYNKALDLFDKSSSQSYQMAACAIEQCDNKIANFCLSNIVKEREYDVMMRTYYAISFINLGDYESGLKEFVFAYQINPFDRVLKYYIEVTKGLIRGDKNALSFIPLKYVKDYPEKVVEEYKTLIKKLINEKIELKVLKHKKNLDALYWGINSIDEVINKECAVLFWFAKNIGGEKILTDLLMSVDIRAGVKRIIIYTLIVFGYNKPFGVIAGSRYKKIKKSKLGFEGEEKSSLFTHAYATLVARMAFWDIDGERKIVKTLKTLYLKFRDEILESDLSTEELAVICLCTSNIEELREQKEIAGYFGVKLSRVEGLIKKMRGEE